MRFPRTVYAIQHNFTKRVYVGSTSTELKQRYTTHISALRYGKHPSALMQEDFNKYGENYTVFILDEIQGLDDRKKEYDWMYQLFTFDPEFGYNQGDFKKKSKGMESVVMRVSTEKLVFKEPNFLADEGNK